MHSLTQNPTPYSTRVKTLPNNIFVVTTLAGDILVHSPPETLKFLLSRGMDIPHTILLPVDIPVGQHLGSSGFVRKGINYASVEFILYMNFFNRGGIRTRLITTTDDQAERMRLILEETISGPSDPKEYFHYRWLMRECRAVSYYPPLGRAPTVDDLVEITSLESGGGDLGALRIQLFDDHFIFIEGGTVVAVIPTDIQETATPLTLAPPRPFQREQITLQFIGGSDGFDPQGITTCFLAYFGKSGQKNATLFDTAAYLRIRLGNLGVSTRQISEVVITHLHEDHLAGLTELLLMGETRARILTSDTIYLSLLRVLSAMLNVPQEEVAALFDYYPLRPGRKLSLDGKQYDVIYAVHSIPTLAVKVNGLYYSGDMRYDEKWFEELEAREVLSPARRQELINFADGAEILVQDVGGGFVHTTLTEEVLHSLASKTKHLILTHTTKHQLPLEEDTAPSRVEFAGTGYVSAVGKPPAQVTKGDILETISLCPLYSRLPVVNRTELMENVTVKNYKPGETILVEDEPSDMHTYIVHHGLVEVWTKGRLLQLMGRGTSIGERGALLGEPRSAAVIAHGPVQLLSLRPDVFQSVAETLGLKEAIQRADWLWNHPTFGHLNWASLLDLSLDFQPRHLRVGECLFEFGKPGHECYLLVSGRVMLIDKNLELIGELTESGEFFGGRAVLFGTPRNASACVSDDSEIWALPAPALHRLQMVYPNVILHLRAVESRRHGHAPMVSIMRPDTD